VSDWAHTLDVTRQIGRTLAACPLGPHDAWVRRRSSWLVGWLLLLVALWPVALWPSATQAQLRPETIEAEHETGEMAGPPDVSLERNLTLADAPEGFEREMAGTLTFEFPSAAREALRQVIDSAATEWLRITRDLGIEPGGPILIRVGRNPDEMAQLAPIEAPPPAYAVGVAYPAMDLILLTLAAPETWERPEVRQVFAHELAHIALHRAVTGGERMGDPWSRSVPRWFDEGIAIHEAGERSIERVETLWQGTLSGQLIPLSELDRSFPSRPHSVNLAYAQSADFVAWILRRGDDGPQKLRQLLSRVRSGSSFEDAVEVTFTATIGQLEDDWRAALGERYGVGPLLLGSGAAWAFIGLLVLLAFRRRRQQKKVVLARWSEEEKVEDEREALRVRARAILAERQAKAEASADGRAAPDVVADPDDEPPPSEPPPPPRPQPEVPSIEWEGDKHTLH